MKTLPLYTILFCLISFVGCVSYRETTPLERPLNRSARWNVGEISLALPSDARVDEAPDEFQLAAFADRLREQIKKAEVFNLPPDTGTGEVEVTGTIIDYGKGSGPLRFLFGVGSGTAYVTVEMQVRDRETGVVLFSGNFIGEVTHWAEKGDKSFDHVAQEFAQTLKRRQMALLK
jgi:hypothetical protein